MAFRTETKTGACLILAAAFLLPLPALAQQGTWQVRHRHLRNGVTGTLRVTPDFIAFDERDKNNRPTTDSRQWKYEDIQLLTLGTQTLRILTYEDRRLDLGRDREFTFDHLPPELITTLYAAWRDRLDTRFVAALADDKVHPDWQLPAKLLHGRGGSQGILKFAADRIVYQSPQGEESRTWRIRDIENVSSSGAFDLTINTHEGDFRFQLKQELTEQSFNRLWRQISSSNGLETLIVE